MRRRGVVMAGAAAGVTVLLTLVVIGGPSTPDRSMMTLRPNDSGVTTLGQRVYAAHCAACHGARLEEQPNWRERDAQGRLPAPPHDASGHTWHHSDEALFRITKFGVAKAAGMPSYESAMPVYEGVLTDQEIAAVLSWIKAQWPADIRFKHDEMNRVVRNQR